MPEQNCGACKWWERPPPPYVNGDCRCPLPICVSERWRAGIDADSGTDCPCWAAKGEANA